MISWRAVACTPEHYQAYMLLWEYGDKQISKEDAAKQLKSFGADKWVNSPSKALIDEIFVTEEHAEANNIEEVTAPKRRAKKKTVTEE
jgi:hypothetical protein